jgi:hypothetical protein
MKMLLLFALSLSYESYEDNRASSVTVSNKSFILDGIKYKTQDKTCVRIMFWSKYGRFVFNQDS